MRKLFNFAILTSIVAVAFSLQFGVPRVPTVAVIEAQAADNIEAQAVEDSGPGVAEVCRDARGLHDAVMSQYPDAKFVLLTIWQQKEIEDYLNKLPPVSNDHFDHIIAVAAPKVPAVLLLIFTKPGCLRYEQEMDINLFTGLIQGT